jgi:hypothetical protein
METNGSNNKGIGGKDCSRCKNKVSNLKQMSSNERKNIV